MKEVILEGRCMTSREAAQEQLQEKLALPSYYGRNLDALYDCLTDCDPPRHLTLRNRAALGETPFGRRLLRVLTDAARNDPMHLKLNLED